MSSHICRVESVNISNNGILVDAQDLHRPSVVYRNTPILADFSGIIAAPEPGQRVIVSKDESGFEYVDGVLTGPEDGTPELEEREFLLQFDPSTRVTFTNDGTGGFDVSLEASGDVDVKASGDIRVGENGEKVAKQSHTHPESGGGDTGTPNESGTNTTIK